MKKIFFSTIFLSFLLIIPNTTHSAGNTIYMATPTNPASGWSAGSDTNDGLSKATPVATLVGAFAKMTSGDTLIIADGIYTGLNNMIGDSTNYLGGGPGHLPPAGSASAYTVIRAEHEGSVTFDGQETYNTFNLGGNIGLSYVEFHGIKWIRPPGGGGIGAVAISWYSPSHHLKWFRCGAMIANASSNIATWSIAGGENYLLEENYAWGTARYMFLISDLHPGFGARKVVLRRNVARPDDVNAAGEPIGGFFVYCASEVELQNNIFLDSDVSKYSNFSWALGAFSIRAGAAEGYGMFKDVHFRGSIALNNVGWAHASQEANWYFPGMMLVNEVAAGPINTAENNVLWDVMAGIEFTGNSVGSPTIRNSTVKIANAPVNDPASPGAVGVYYWAPSVWSMKNSIVINPQKIAVRGTPSDYNAVFSSGDYDFFATTPGPNDYTDLNHNEINPFTGNPGNGTPGLKYIVKQEVASDLYGTGEGGVNRGATVLNRYGVSGTMWGESGYNTLTNESLWPFPYESVMKRDFATYSSANISGARGFVAPGTGLYGGPITLTSYIWEYLGNPCPADICTAGTLPPPDTTPPSAPSGVAVD